MTVELWISENVQLEFHVHHAKEAARVARILSLLDPKTGKETKKSPRCLAAKQNAIIEVSLKSNYMCIDMLMFIMLVNIEKCLEWEWVQGRWKATDFVSKLISIKRC